MVWRIRLEDVVRIDPTDWDGIALWMRPYAVYYDEGGKRYKKMTNNGQIFAWLLMWLTACDNNMWRVVYWWIIEIEPKTWQYPWLTIDTDYYLWSDWQLTTDETTIKIWRSIWDVFDWTENIHFQIDKSVSASVTSVTWWAILWDITDQEDLNDALAGKAPSLWSDDNYVTDAEKWKLWYISITQPVDLDALEANTYTKTEVDTADTNTLNAAKAYADAVQQWLDTKLSVRAATTANITLSGTQTIDWVSLTVWDRVLVKDQSTGSQNGIYVVASWSWSRSTDANTSAKVTSGMYAFVEEGTVNGDYWRQLITNGTITLGTTALVFTQFNGAGQVIPWVGISKSANTLSLDINWLGNKTTPLDADKFSIYDVAGAIVATVTRSNIKTTLKAFFDTLYQPLTTVLTNTTASFTTALKSTYDWYASGKENAITSGSTSQYWRWDKTWQTLDKWAVWLGSVDNTSDSTKNSATATLTNKRITRRVSTNTSLTTSVTIDSDSFDKVIITAQAWALLFNNPSGTPTEWQLLWIEIKDNGTARALTYGTQFRSMQDTLLATTTVSKRHNQLFKRNSTDSKWDLLALNTQA